jgi:hypothetical protein
MATITASRFVTQEEIDKAYSSLSQQFGGRKEDYFGVLYLSRKFNISENEAASFIALGGSTNAGIDGYYHDTDRKTLYLYAFRWSEDHMSFKEPLEKLGNNGINKIFFDPTKYENDHPLIVSLKTHLSQNWKDMDRVIIDFVFNGDPVDAEQSKVLSFLRESVEDKRGYVESYFGRIGEAHSHDLIFRYVSNISTLGTATSSRESAQYAINFESSLSISSSSGENSDPNQMKVIFLSLADLYRMYSDLGERFFEKNLRSGLGEGKMTNTQIRNSLQRILDGQEDAGNFALYHNGVTLTAQILEDGAPSTIKMTEPRILNGAQTVKILKHFVDEGLSKKREKTGRSRKKIEDTESHASPLSLMQKKLSEAKVLARVIRTSDEEFLKKVTISNNRQNPIMPWNLKANDLSQISFEELFAKLGIYYERRENAFKSLMEEDADVASIDGEKGVVEARKLAQTLLALQGQIDRMSQLKEVFENEKWYRDTFKEQYLAVDPRKLVLLYKVQFRLTSAIREIKGIGVEKYGYASRAKNLIWCLSLQGLMNDAKFEKYVEAYGNSTGVEAGITEILKKIATTKIRYILSDTFESRKYRDQIEGGKFSFLKSRATLADCMKVAQERYDWQKKSL